MLAGRMQPASQGWTTLIQFIQGLPSLEILKDASQSLVGLDDLIHYPKDVITKIFTVYSHHYNFSVIFTTQNLFNKSIREISLNSHFVVLFKNCHDVTQIHAASLPRKCKKCILGI